MWAIEYQDEGNLEEPAVRQSADCFLLYRLGKTVSYASFFPPYDVFPARIQCH